MNLVDLLLEKKDGIATMTLNAPDKLNAISTKMKESLFLAMDDVNKDDSVKVVILTGAGRGFCAGHDISQCEVPLRKNHPFMTALIPQIMRHLSSSWTNR